MTERRLRVAVVLFPGSNCDRDAVHAFETVLDADARLLWHDAKELRFPDLGDPDLVILPGGFSYGDYLRCGAMARFSPLMESVKTYAANGGAVLGICNGFQILCEARLLPGTLLQNAGLRFLCQDVYLRVESTRTPFTSGLSKGDVLRLPIAHGDGNWNADPADLPRLAAKEQLLFRYVNARGEVEPEANPNGSMDAVAGVCNEAGNVAGLMPHPERAAEAVLGNEDGARLLRSTAFALAKRLAA